MTSFLILHSRYPVAMHCTTVLRIIHRCCLRRQTLAASLTRFLNAPLHAARTYSSCYMLSARLRIAPASSTAVAGEYEGVEC